MTFNRFAGLGTLHALRTLVFRLRTAWLRRFQGRERDVRDESASVCLGGAGRQCIEAVLPLAPDEVRVDVRAPSRSAARIAKAQADIRGMASAVVVWGAHMGVLPSALGLLTAIATNAQNITAGPFMAAIPTPPSTAWGSAYFYAAN